MTSATHRRLKARHRAELEASAISRDVQRSCGFYTAGREALAELGFAGYQARAGIAFPIYDVRGRVAYTVAKPDEARERRGRLGEPGKPVKYETPAGARVVLYVPPCARERVVGGAEPLVITEGMKKAASAASAGLAVVGVVGVWAWKRKRRPLPCWKKIPLRGRRVLVVFDSDIASNSGVRAALLALCRYLRRRGAKVEVPVLPATADGGKVGLDDWLAAEPGNRRTPLARLRRLAQQDLEPSDRLAGNDTANARRFVALHGEHVRWEEAHGFWIAYDGVRWKPEAGGQVWEWALDVGRQLTAEAAEERDADKATRLRKLANYAHNARGVEGMLKGVRSLLRVSAAELDSNGYLLNFQNGTLELDPDILRENGWQPVLRPHDPEDLITRVVRGDYVPGARSGDWDALLRASVPWRRTRRFLARCLGACLVGVPLKHFLYVQGPADSGKTTLFEALFWALGDYARAFEPEVFLSHRGGSPNSPEVAVLPGVRLALSAELPPRGMFNSALLKRITGGDTLSARALYRMPFNFVAVAFPVFVGNWMPGIEYHEKALWERCLILRFKGPAKHKDRALPGRLRLPEAVDAILAMAVDGYLDLARRGFDLAPTPRVRDATEAHRVDMDTMSGFFEDKCVERGGAFVPAAKLYDEYKYWAEDSGVRRPLSRHQFTRELRSRGYSNQPKKRIKGEVTAVWWGLKLRA